MIIRVAQDKVRDIHPLMWAVSGAFLVYFGINVLKAITGIA